MRGQIASMDFIVSMIAATLAVGLIIQVVELNTYNQQEERLFQEIKQVGENAANLLVGSEATTCQLKTIGGTNLIKIINCIDAGQVDTVAKVRSNLGIPSDYGFLLDIGSLSSVSSGTQGSKDFYDVNRLVVIEIDGLINKAEFEDNSFNGPYGALIRVWKE